MTDLKKMMDDLYNEVVVQGLEKDVRRTALQVFKNIVQMTPVEFGGAKLNWNVDINVIDLSLTPPPATAPDAGFYNELKALSATARYKAKDIIYISNNLPYIERLNEGSSQQAPAGYIQSAIDTGTRQAEDMKD